MNTPKSYVIYRYDVPFTGKFTVETGTHEEPAETWAGPGDHDPIEHQH